MRDPIDELENFDPGPAMTPLPANEVRRRGDRLRRRNNALATVGGLAAVAALAVPFAVFAGDSSPDSVQPAPQVDWVTTIPADFDLGALPEEASFAFDVRNAGAVDDISLCGVTAFATEDGATDTAGATWAEPDSDGAQARTLALYADADAATNALAGLRQGVLDCPREEREGNLDPFINDVVDVTVPGADEAFAFTNQVEGADLIYDLTAYTVARVGNALYLVDSHSTAGGEQAIGMFDFLVDNSAPVLDQMCVFSANGCGGDVEAEDPIGEGAVPAIPEGFPLDAGLPTSPTVEKAPSPEPTACGASIAVPDTVVETAHAQWRDYSQIQDRQLMTFATQADAQAYVDSIVGIYCVEDDKGRGAMRITRVYPADLGDYAISAVGHNEVDGEVDAGLLLTHVVRVGRAVLLSQRIDEGYAFTGDVDQQSDVLVSESLAGLGPAVEAMCTFTEQGC